MKADLRGMAKECKLCKFGGGACTTGFRKQHERTDPHRLFGVTDRGNNLVPNVVKEHMARARAQRQSL